MANINYDDFEEQIKFIENGKHLNELEMTGVANVNPALITRKQQLEKKLANLEKEKAKVTDDLAEVDKAIALEKAAKTTGV